MALAGGAVVLAADDDTSGAGQSSTAATSTSSTASSTTPSGGGPAGSGTSGGTSSGAAPAAGAGALETCARAVHAAEQVAAAQEPGARNWRVHTQAWIKLLDGEFTKAQADADWRRSREAGPGDVQRFREAYRSYEATEIACGDVVQQVPAEQAGAAAACLVRGTEADDAIASGRVVLEQWAGHLKQMGQRRTHELPPDKALAMFRAAVARSGEDLSDYERDRGQLEGAPACAVPGA